MAVARMKKLTVATAAGARDAVAGLLQKEGVVQIRPLEDLAAELGAPGDGDGAAAELGVARIIPEDDEVSEDLGRVSFILKFLEPFAGKRKGLLDAFVTRKTAVSRERAERVNGLRWRSIYEQCVASESKLRELESREAKLLQAKAALEPWTDVPLPVSAIGDTESCRVRAFAADRRKYRVLGEEMSRLGELHDLVTVTEDKQRGIVYFIVVYHQSAEEVESVLAAHDPTPVRLEEIASSLGLSADLTPGELVREIRGEMGLVAEEKARVRATAAEMAKNLVDYMLLYDALEVKRQKAEVQRRFLATERAVVFQGWVPERKVADLRSSLERLSTALGQPVGCVEEDPVPGEESSVPVMLDNPPWLKPFEVVTTLYGYPNYGEPDPTPLLAPFFFVFFGLALGDAGYGVALMLGSYLALKALDLPEGGKMLLRLLLICGVSTTFFGAITGSYFGNAVELLPESLAWVKRAKAAVTFFDPLSNPLTMLALSLAFGVVQVWTGVLIKMLLNLRRGNVTEGVFEQGSWLLLIAGLVLWGVGGQLGFSPALVRAFGIAALAGAGMVAYGASRHQPSILLKPFTGAYALYGITGYVGDVLSYARLLALGLATSIIAIVVNQIAMLPRGVPVAGVIFMVVVMAGGHAFNLIVNTLGSFVHSARLQFVEFFTKFFEGGGRGFRPFKEETKYTEVR